MVPVCFPSKISSTTGLREAVVFALSSVTGLVRWTDYIPVKLVASADAALEGRTDAGGFIPMDMLSSNTGMMGWVDYLPVYVDNSATDAWAITATGFIPYAASGGGVASLPRTYPASFNILLSSPVGATIADGTGVVTINYVGVLNPVITANRTSGVGPLFIVFDALASQAAPSLTTLPFFEVFYDWDFGDSASAAQTWNYGTQAGSATRNTAFGPVAGHVFEGAGSYTVTLRARYRGIGGVLTTQTTTMAVTVSAADTVFASSTVYVSNTALPVAGVDGVPSGATCQLVTSWSALSGLSATYKRILLRAGESWNTDGSVSLAQGPGLLGKYGAGAVPSVTVVANGPAIYLNGCSDWRILDLYITGNGTQGDSKRFIVGGSGYLGAGGHYLIQRVEMNDMLMGLGFSTTSGVGIVDCYVHDTYDASLAMSGICVYSSQVTHLAILGSRFSRSPSTHVVRLQGTATTTISHSQFDSAGGNALTIRGMAGSVDDGNGHIMWTGEWTDGVVVSDCVIDNSLISDGGYALYCGPQAIGHAERLRNVLVERNYIAGKDAQSANFQVVSGLVVRGNLFSARYALAIGLGLGGNVAGSPATTGAYFMNNTIYKPDTAVTLSFSPFYFSDPGLGSGLLITNTLVYAPGNNRDGAGNGTQATFYVQGGTAGTDGVNFTLSSNSSDMQINTVKPWAAISPVAYADYVPNGYGKGSGAFVPMFSDFFNTEITGTRDMGAIKA